jgi:cytochrome c-type biogenesis protein CcmH
MASFEQEQYRAAIAYWERLLAMEAPDSESGRMIAEVIETARQNLAAAEPGALDTTTTATTVANLDVASGAGVSVHVPLPEGADIAASDTVFILARNAEGGSRMPIAVQRLTGAQLPVTLRLDDSNSMAGQKLSEASSVIVAVQVSPQGRPGEDNATWLGQVGPLSPTDTNEPIEIELRANIR